MNLTVINSQRRIWN